MGTSSAIGMKMEDGSVRAIRCNWDGYVAGVGAILGGWYDTPELVKGLLDLGDLSSLGTTFADTVAYHRDRSEVMRIARDYRDINAYRRDGKSDFGADYLYLNEGGKWFVYGVADEDWIELQVTVNQGEK